MQYKSCAVQLYRDKDEDRLFVCEVGSNPLIAGNTIFDERLCDLEIPSYNKLIRNIPWYETAFDKIHTLGYRVTHGGGYYPDGTGFFYI